MKKIELPASLIFHNKVIDDDHRRIVGFLNDIIESVEGGNVEEGVMHLGDFFSAAQHHFQNEEEILRQADYPDLQQHADCHKQLAGHEGRLQKLAEKAGDSDEAKEFFLVELTSFVLDDALKADMDFKSFLEDAGVCKPPIDI